LTPCAKTEDYLRGLEELEHSRFAAKQAASTGNANLRLFPRYRLLDDGPHNISQALASVIIIMTDKCISSELG
jgi:hypothetical protein